MFRCSVYVLVVLLTAAFVSDAGTGSATIYTSRDTTIYSEDGNAANGFGEYMFSGRTSLGSLRRALVYFNVTNNIPGGSTVTNAVLTLNLSDDGGVGDMSASIYRLTNSWGEANSDAGASGAAGAAAVAGEATWTSRFHTVLSWATNGGDYVGIPSATVAAGASGQYTWSSSQMVADVQGWIDNPDPTRDAGWILLIDESVTSMKRFGSRNNSNSNVWPTLQVDYLLPKPLFTAITFVDDKVFLSITNLAIGVSNQVQLTMDLQSNMFSETDSFTPTSNAEIWMQSVSSTTQRAFYRIVIE